MAEEKRLQDKILKDLRSYGKNIVVFKIQKTSDSGVPDVFFITLFTDSVFIELKKTGKSADARQRAMIKKLRKTGAKAFICDTWNGWIKIKKDIGLNSKNIGNAASLFKK